jgi:hypothetical protein
MINDVKEIIGIIFMTIIGVLILWTLATSVPNDIAASFASLGIVLLILAAIAGIAAIIKKILD